jgi:hypothetical protein
MSLDSPISLVMGLLVLSVMGLIENLQPSTQPTIKTIVLQALM